MDKLADIIKLFLERHLIPSLIGVVGTIITLLFVSNENWIILKIGKSMFMILTFCLYFLAIQMFFFLDSTIKKARSDKSDREYDLRQIHENNKEIFQETNEFIDRLQDAEKKILLSFVKNDNKTLIEYETSHGIFFDYMHLFDESGYFGQIRDINTDQYWIGPLLAENLNDGCYYSGGLKQYKIKGQIFRTLRAIYESTGKLGNF